MKPKRSQWPGPSEVHELMAELGELVEDLGLEAVPAARQLASTEAAAQSSTTPPAATPPAPATVAGADPAAPSTPVLAGAVPPPPAAPARTPAGPVPAVKPEPPVRELPGERAAGGWRPAVPGGTAGDAESTVPWSAGTAAPSPPGQPRLTVVPGSRSLSADTSAVPDTGGGDSTRVLVPLWESGDEESDTAPVPTTTLWEAFSPALQAPPPRPWTPEAAMAGVEPAAPPAPGRSKLDADDTVRRSRLMPILATVVGIIAIGVVIASRLDLASTSGPPSAVVQVPFQVTNLRTVQATSAADVATAPTQTHFPSSASAIFIDVTYRNVTRSDALRITITLQPRLGVGQEQTVSDETHSSLDPGGEIAVTVSAPPGGFLPGRYTVRAYHDNSEAQTWTFEVDPPGAPSR